MASAAGLRVTRPAPGIALSLILNPLACVHYSPRQLTGGGCFCAPLAAQEPDGCAAVVRQKPARRYPARIGLPFEVAEPYHSGTLMVISGAERR